MGELTHPIVSGVFRLAGVYSQRFWEVLSGTPERARLYFNTWRRSMELVYGREVLEGVKGLEDLFARLTIYVTWLKCLGATLLEAVLGGGRYTLPARLYTDGYSAAVDLFWHRRALARFNVNYLFERDEYDWVFDPGVAPQFDKFFRDVGKLLLSVDWSQEVGLDLLKQVYQNIVPREVRRQLGEFYTPDWIAQLILWRALHVLVRGSSSSELLVEDPVGRAVELVDEFYRKYGRVLRFIDPTCGSFTFGVHYISSLLRWYSERRPSINAVDFAKQIMESVVGIDLNPVAVITAKVNYLLQIHRLLMIYGGYLTVQPILPILRVDLLSVHAEGEFRQQVLEEGFDLVLGNLPWVNVSKYPKEYSEVVKGVAKELGVSPPPQAAKKLDISIPLFAVALKYLAASPSVTALMVPCSIFKGLHGAAWRAYVSSPPYRVIEVWDLEEVKPFEGADNQPGIVFVLKRTKGG